MTQRLSREELEAIGKGYDPRPAHSFSINANCYQDPKYLAVEREQIFHRSWQFLCHEEKLREPGSYVATNVQGQSIFATRDSYGTLRAFYNVCKHRGHELLRGEGKGSVIACPYHAWGARDSDGRHPFLCRREMSEPASARSRRVGPREFASARPLSRPPWRPRFSGSCRSCGGRPCRTWPSVSARRRREYGRSGRAPSVWRPRENPSVPSWCPGEHRRWPPAGR